jgi:hypothetical protein
MERCAVLRRGGVENETKATSNERERQYNDE